MKRFQRYPQGMTLRLDSDFCRYGYLASILMPVILRGQVAAVDGLKENISDMQIDTTATEESLV
jgi:hypothetical protein